MKNLIFIFSLIFFILVSCDRSVNDQSYLEELSLNNNLNNVVSVYESIIDSNDDFVIKKYTEVGEKNELLPSNVPETTASLEVINYIKNKINLQLSKEPSKTTRNYAIPSPYKYMVGVFKTNTCGNSPEFIYRMDCEDGGWTNINNPSNKNFATFVDSNGNIEFHMCVVEGANFGGYALSLGVIHNSLIPTLKRVKRYHDNEDHKNKNSVLSSVKPDSNGFIGESQFRENTLFTWVKDKSSRYNNIQFSYGVVSGDGNIEINIDDENGKNANWAQYMEMKNNSGQWLNCPYKEWFDGMYLWENTSYKIKLN